MSNENNKCNCTCTPEKSEYVNSRPEFSLWLDMIAIQNYQEYFSPYQQKVYSKVKLIIAKMASEKSSTGELNWMFCRDELFQYNFGKETLYDKLFRTLSHPSFFESPEDVWDDVMIKNLIEVREAWQNYWMLFMTCPFGSGDMIKNCTGWRCMAWDTENECCYRVEKL